MEMRRFTMIRQGDASGVSGTGRVLDGVVTHNGHVVVCWRTEAVHGHSSIAVYDSYEAFKFIHIDSHPSNGTMVKWIDDISDDVPYEEATLFDNILLGHKHSVENMHV